MLYLEDMMDVMRKAEGPLTFRELGEKVKAPYFYAVSIRPEARKVDPRFYYRRTSLDSRAVYDLFVKAGRLRFDFRDAILSVMDSAQTEEEAWLATVEPSYRKSSDARFAFALQWRERPQQRKGYSWRNWDDRIISTRPEQTDGPRRRRFKFSDLPTRYQDFTDRWYEHPGDGLNFRDRDTRQRQKREWRQEWASEDEQAQIDWETEQAQEREADQLAYQAFLDEQAEEEAYWDDVYAREESERDQDRWSDDGLFAAAELGLDFD